MAASSGDDIKTQLANILGRPLARIGQIRKTDETPPRISVIDVVIVITGKNARNAARDVGFLKERYPDVTQKLSDVKLVDSLGRRGQRSTPVTCATGIIEIVLLLPGRVAARVRRQTAELLCRYLAGDLSLVDEICRFRGIQEELAVQAPEDPVGGRAEEVGGWWS